MAFDRGFSNGFEQCPVRIRSSAGGGTGAGQRIVPIEEFFDHIKGQGEPTHHITILQYLRGDVPRETPPKPRKQLNSDEELGILLRFKLREEGISNAFTATSKQLEALEWTFDPLEQARRDDEDILLLLM